MLVKSKLFVSLAALVMLLQLGAAHAATVVALRASNTAGKGVSPSGRIPPSSSPCFERGA
jgi:acyl-CoA thioesterase-1